MKKLLFVFAASVALTFGQSTPAFSVTAAADPYTNRTCNDQANIGSIYTDLRVTPSVTWICQRSSTGHIAWVQSFVAVVGGGGSLSVASGKIFTASNTLTMAGTDSTTMTFPGTSATIARSDAANTFTGIQTFLSRPVLNTGTASFNGKIFTVSNTLTLAGTDSTTMTFPTTSASVARTDAGQTFTGTQVFGAVQAATVNYVATENGANDAIACAASSGPSIAAGLEVAIKLAHTISTGATTFAYNGGATKSIKSHLNVANNVAVAYASGSVLTVIYDGTQWQDVSQ